MQIFYTLVPSGYAKLFLYSLYFQFLATSMSKLPQYQSRTKKQVC